MVYNRASRTSLESHASYKFTSKTESYKNPLVVYAHEKDRAQEYIINPWQFLYLFVQAKMNREKPVHKMPAHRVIIHTEIGRGSKTS